MKVDFDNLRKHLACSYNKAFHDFTKLPESYEKEQLADSLNDIRTYIGTLLACESSGDDVFDSIDIELEPRDE